MATASARGFLEKPEKLATVKVKTESGKAHSMCCVQSKKEFYIGKVSEFIKLYDTKGKFLKKIKTDSGNFPQGLAMTKDGDLLYGVFNDRSFNIVKGGKIQNIVSLKGWYPIHICCTSSDDLLVSMTSTEDMYAQNEDEPGKVVRYEISPAEAWTAAQEIQFGDEDRPLFYYPQFIAENRKNQDVCVVTRGPHPVVVVDKTGKFRFGYEGNGDSKKRVFTPRGIATDSLGNILVADHRHNRIHVVNEDGKLLRYIRCSLNGPWCISISSDDSLFVENDEDNTVSVIKYLH